MQRSVLWLVVTCSLSAALGAQGLQPPPVPPGNPITLEKTLLGKSLFWDEQLSSTQTVACGTCHISGAGGSDPRSQGPGTEKIHPGPDDQLFTPDDIFGSPGVIENLANGLYNSDTTFDFEVQVTNRRSMSMINAAYSQNLFWDGRAEDQFRDPMTNNVVLQQFAALESQSVGPPLSDVEMAHVDRDWPEVIARLATVTPLALASDIPTDLNNWIGGRNYPALFTEVFGDPSITATRIAFAIATYERTLFSDQTPFDDFLTGNQNALTPLEQQGHDLFNSPRTSCNACHSGPLLSDDLFHNTGVRPQAEDLGRGAVTGNPGDNGRFRTPSLRNVELRGPFFHNGRQASLMQVVNFYNRGGDFNAPNKSPLIRPLGLNPQERDALVAFLSRPLTDLRVTNEQAPFDRPTLYSESNRTPQIIGSGTAGSGGFVPEMIAIEPPLLGNDNFTVGIRGGMPGFDAFLLIDTVSVSNGFPWRGTTCYLGLSPQLIVQSAGLLSGIGPGNGTTSVALEIPDTPNLNGLQVSAQWFVNDPSGLQPLSASEAALMTLF